MGRRFLTLILVPANVLTGFAGIIIVIMMLHVTADVVGKYLFNTPVENTLEIVSAYYMVAVIFFPLAYVSHNQGHIIVELFTRNLSTRKLAALEAIVGVVGLLFMAVFTWMGIEMAIKKTVIGEAWETADDLVEVWPSRWVLPVGCCLMTIYMFYRIIRDTRTALAKDNEHEDPVGTS